MRRLLSIILPVLLAAWLFPQASPATTEYARQTGKQCAECHVEAIGGGPLTKAGEGFLADRKVKGLYRPLSAVQKAVRLFVGYLHLLTAIAWFGTIFYVHLLLKPAYAAKGLPKGELFLGWISIVVISITGILLTVARIPAWEVFYTTRFGILLSIKIGLFLIMAFSATIVTFYIGPRLRRRLKDRYTADICAGRQDLTIEELHSFSGSEGKPAFIVYKGKIYDVSKSRLWKDGAHARKHHAGSDLTDALKTAPHGEEKVLSMPEVGKLIATGTKIPRPLPERIFYTLAYLNLGFVFLITFVIALWKWI